MRIFSKCIIGLVIGLASSFSQAQNNKKNDIYRTAQAIQQSVNDSQASNQDLSEASNLLNRAYDLINYTSRPVECGRVYEDQNFRGRMVSINSGEAIYNLSSYNMNDVVSSVFVFRGCQMELWEHKNMGGRSAGFRNEVPSLPGDLDNYFTSLRCNCN